MFVCTDTEALLATSALKPGGHFSAEIAASFGSKYLNGSLRLVLSIQKTRWKWNVCDKCFMGLVQSDLDDIRRHWNTHRIHRSAGSRWPAGITDILYYLPDPPAADCAFRAHVQLIDQLLQQLEESNLCTFQITLYVT